MTVVVTGGFGYAGGRIVGNLLQEGVEVRVSSRRTAADIPSWASGRVRWSSDLAALSDGANCLIHLAAPNEIVCAEQPDKAIADTVALTQAAVDAVRAAGIGRMIYASTVHVYGPLRGQIDETTAPTPVHPYAVAHLESEDIVAAAAGSGDMEAVTLRLSNGYGAPADNGTDRWSLLVNDLCRQAVTKRRLALKSDGTQLRDFLPLTDVARAFAHFAMRPSLREGYEVFNLSAGRSMSVRAMAELVLERARHLLGDDIELVIPHAPDAATEERLTIDNRALMAAGFRPSTPPESEIDGMLAFCKAAFSPHD